MFVRCARPASARSSVDAPLPEAARLRVLWGLSRRYRFIRFIRPMADPYGGPQAGSHAASLHGSDRSIDPAHGGGPAMPGAHAQQQQQLWPNYQQQQQMTWGTHQHAYSTPPPAPGYGVGGRADLPHGGLDPAAYAGNRGSPGQSSGSGFSSSSSGTSWQAYDPYTGGPRQSHGHVTQGKCRARG